MQPGASGRATLLARALAALAVCASLSACAGPRLVPAVVDYKAGMAVLRIADLSDERSRAPARDATIVYNLDHEEGRKAAARASAQGQEPPLAYTLAHNVALRLREADAAFAAAGVPVPVVLVSTRANPRGWIATGSATGEAFVEADPGLLAEPRTVEVSGGIFRSGGRGAGDRLEARLALAGPLAADRQEHSIGYLDPEAAERAGLGRWPVDPRAQLIARLADHLAPHALDLAPPDAPVGFVREVGEGGALICDLGLERRTLHLDGFLETFDPPLPPEPSLAELELLLRHRYVRIQLAGHEAPPEHPVWVRVRVREAE